MKTVTFDETQWKLVPVEPTAEMRLAARAMRISDEDESWAVYSAMLTAAPKPDHGENDGI